MFAREQLQRLLAGGVDREHDIVSALVDTAHDHPVAALHTADTAQPGIISNEDHELRMYY